jgi:hypothetical protein
MAMQLKPGEKIVYYEGASLARLREKAKRQLDLVVTAADVAWRLALRGEVDLLQRRTDKGIQYFMVGRAAVDRHPVLPHQETEVKQRAA